MNGNINANQPFNLYKRNRWRRGRWAAVPLTCGCECGRCSFRLYCLFFFFLLWRRCDVDSHPLRTFTAASKLPCLCLDERIIAPLALGDPNGSLGGGKLERRRGLFDLALVPRDVSSGQSDIRSNVAVKNLVCVQTVETIYLFILI